jgi:hypothetical protein
VFGSRTAITTEKNKTVARGPVLYSVAALSVLAALIHLWVTPEHFEEWWGYGAFFLSAAIAQGAYGAVLLRWPRRPLLLLGVVGNLSIVVLYVVTRTVGVPVLGPQAGEVEGVGATDLCATVSELAIVLAVGAVLLQGMSPQIRRTVLIVSAVALLGLAHLVHLLLSESS